MTTENTTEATQSSTGTDQERIALLERNSVSVNLALCMCLVAVLVSLAAAWFGYGQATKRGWIESSTAKVVFLDFEEVMEAGISKVMEQEKTSVSEAKEDAVMFQKRISASLDSYTTRGYVVINKRALIDGAAAHDITPEVIRSLGLVGKK